MNAALKASAMASLGLAAAGCQVNVDENTQARLENAGEAIEGAASGAANLAESAAASVENEADQIGNAVDVDVNLRGDGKKEVTANTH